MGFLALASRRDQTIARLLILMAVVIIQRSDRDLGRLLLFHPTWVLRFLFELWFRERSVGRKSGIR
jgi:hypothetical protein